MKVKTLGQSRNPAVLMIPGMFCTSDVPELAAKYLANEYYVILPTLDGHHREEPVYHGVDRDAAEIVGWLEDNGVTRLALLQGTSMGAEVALAVAARIRIPVDHWLLDGGPCFHFPRFFRAIMARKFNGYMNMVRGKTTGQAVDALMKDPFVKKLGGDSLDSYRGMLGGFCEIGQWIDSASVRRIADTCYRCVLPDIPDETARRFVFLYSENEPARKSEKRLKKKYPQAAFLVAKGYGHGGFQGEQPEKYAGLMRDIIEGRELRI